MCYLCLNKTDFDFNELFTPEELEKMAEEAAENIKNAAIYGASNPNHWLNMYPKDNHPQDYDGSDFTPELDEKTAVLPCPLLNTRENNCYHEWVDVGFNISKVVCKKCNKEQNK